MNKEKQLGKTKKDLEKQVKKMVAITEVNHSNVNEGAIIIIKIPEVKVCSLDISFGYFVKRRMVSTNLVLQWVFKNYFKQNLNFVFAKKHFKRKKMFQL